MPVNSQTRQRIDVNTFKKVSIFAYFCFFCVQAITDGNRKFHYILFTQQLIEGLAFGE
jgi:hypothetical protein